MTDQLSRAYNELYQNPILFADYSDPDAIRVGDDFWMIASSFSHAPGLPILHSTDLVHWDLVNHALPRNLPEEHYQTHRAGCGVWAPAIRHHDGLFWIFYPDPDYGIYVITASDPRGEWSTPYLIKAGAGLIDPCPQWDGDKAYLVHGWAKSRAGICNTLTLHEMSLDATKLLDDGTVIIDGDKDTDWNTIEGPKLYKHNGWYWIFAPADGVATGFQAVFRSRSIHGPYEGRNVLHQGSTPVNGPHQGAWVDTPDGEHWFMHFQERQPFGRIVHLQPMSWRADGWPIMGHAPEGTGTGEPVSAYPIPKLPPAPKTVPQSDTFPDGSIGRQWQWQANPSPNWIDYEATKPGLNLACSPRPETNSFWKHGPILLQKLTGPELSACVTLELTSKTIGDATGLILFGYDYFWIGLVRSERGMQLQFRECRDAQDGTPETLVDSTYTEYCQLKLKLESKQEGQCQFSYSIEDEPFTPFGPQIQARESKWVGAKFGIFATNLEGIQTSSTANFQKLTVS